MSPGTPKKPGRHAITPAQHASVRRQLSAILKGLGAGTAENATAQATQLVRKHPGLPETNHVAAACFARCAQIDRAIYYAARAAELDPATADYHAALGVLLVQASRYEQSIPPLERAVGLDPAHAQAQGALGIALLGLGRIDESRTALDRAIALDPENPEPMMNLALLESDIADSARAIEIMRRALEKFPASPILHDSMAMFASYDDRLTPEEVWAIHADFGRAVEARVKAPSRYPNDPDPDRRLRIGFVSPDFKEHSIAYFVEPIFDRLDRRRFELCLYSTGSAADEITARFKAGADLWRDCTRGVADTHARIAADRVDILVELTGHFASNQLPVFAARPAPVSVTAIGYGNTTGLSSIDARIVDPITDPAPDADALASEKLVRMDRCFLCYRPPADAPQIGAAIEQHAPPRPFTFGSFNDLRKMSPTTLRLWARILGRSPDSRLVLKSSRLAQPQVRDLMLGRLADLGVDPDRLTLLGRTATTRRHLALYDTIDCSLDTFPYTGTTTTCESLLMGVPTITLLGRAHAGRVSASLLTAIDRPDLIAPDEDSYIELAIARAAEGVRPMSDRAALRESLLRSPLVDEAGYARALEGIYRSLWKDWCAAPARSSSPKGPR